MTSHRQKLTWRVELPEGQRRLREAILYVAQKCERAAHFGMVKLNKILWRADFRSFERRGTPVTGRQYTRQQFGPVPFEGLPIIDELQRDGLLKIERSVMFGLEQKRPLAQADPVLRFFSEDDLSYLDEAIDHYWTMTGSEASDLSHGVAWKTRANGDPMPYEAAYLSDQPLSDRLKDKVLRLAAEHNWRSE